MDLGVHHASNPDPYQGLWGGHRDSVVQSSRASESTVVDGVCSSADKYVGQLEEVIKYSIPKKGVAAFFAESIQCYRIKPAMIITKADVDFFLAVFKQVMAKYA